MKESKLIDFGIRYAEAWCSQEPDRVAAFFAEAGSLTVNNGPPSVGRTAIAKSAEGFMTDFPDLVVVMDKMVKTQDGAEFHWTLIGTNNGPGGTGKKVKVSGKEVWQFDDTGLVWNSVGSFDVGEYDRQLRSE